VLTLGLDVGGSKLLAALVDGDGRIRRVARQATGRGFGPASLVELAIERVERLRAAGEAPGAIGVGFPGLVDHARGVVRSSIMLDGWREVPLAAAIERAAGLPCIVDNDVNAAAVCEAALRGDGDSMLFVAVGTGIGGAICLGRELWRGAGGVAGEIGNVVVERGGLPCRCGRRGCLNTVASGAAIERAAEIAPGSLAREWRAGNPRLGRAVEDAAAALAVVLGDVANLLNPALIVLGGGVAELGAPWLARVERHLRGEAFPEALERCRLELARSGYRAGAVGAALLARAAARAAAGVEAERVA